MRNAICIRFQWLLIQCAISGMALTANAQYPYAVRTEAFKPPRYFYGIYYVAGQPFRFRNGKPVWDISGADLVRAVFDRLKQLGINMATFAYAVRRSEALYPSDAIPQSKWWRSLKLDPVRMFLDECARCGIMGFLAIWTPPVDAKVDIEFAKRALTDIAQRYGRHPGFAGFVPPVEATPLTGIPDDAFAMLAKHAKALCPDKLVMDFPCGAYLASTIPSAIAHARSGAVDIMNVQFFVADERYFRDDFLLVRGLTQFIIGVCEPTPTLIHTHYMLGSRRPFIPKPDAWRVRLGALLTATQYGCHQWSYFHAFHGVDSQSGEDTTWRWCEWSKGILSVQRIAPFLANVHNASRTAILINRFPRGAAFTALKELWRPLMKAGVSTKFTTALNKLTTVDTLIISDPVGISREQAGIVEQFVRAGGTVIVLASPLPPKLTPRQARIFGLPLEPLPPQFVEFLGVTLGEECAGRVRFERPRTITIEDAHGCVLRPSLDATVIARWSNGAPAAVMVERGRGKCFVIPHSEEITSSIIASLAHRATRMHMRVRNLPDGWAIESYRMHRDEMNYKLVILMAGIPNAVARNVEIEVPLQGMNPRFAGLITSEDTRIIPLKCRNGRAILRIDEASEWVGIIVGESAYPIILPTPLAQIAHRGARVTVTCHMLNLYREPIAGTLIIEPPPKWRVIGDAERKFKLRPTEMNAFEFKLSVPNDAVRDAHFIAFHALGLTQRAMVFVSDGIERIISRREPPKVKPAPKRPVRHIGDKWLAVVAGDPSDMDVRRHTPGVCFYKNLEWDEPVMHDGKMARYGENIPVLGGPNFLINAPDLNADVEIEVTCWANAPASIRVYDGKRYNVVARIERVKQWVTVRGIVPRKFYADRPAFPGFNVLFDFHAPSGIYIHRIAVRKVKPSG